MDLKFEHFKKLQKHANRVRLTLVSNSRETEFFKAKIWKKRTFFAKRYFSSRF